MGENTINDRSTTARSLRFEVLCAMFDSQNPCAWRVDSESRPPDTCEPSLLDWCLSLFAQYLCILIGKLYLSNYTGPIATTQGRILTLNQCSVSCQDDFVTKHL
ncbi:hypothetical protein RRG08_034926 [Elysia crispata]|uniref:Uncharacterized protein n=1 Tax=Elysia crispata TaxID=231223 RepID=A0AAE0Y290_9GAST|nr:hypothetical protein RRG08_034926 [Elysia crispata]